MYWINQSQISSICLPFFLYFSIKDMSAFLYNLFTFLFLLLHSSIVLRLSFSFFSIKIIFLFLPFFIFSFTFAILSLYIYFLNIFLSILFPQLKHICTHSYICIYGYSHYVWLLGLKIADSIKVTVTLERWFLCLCSLYIWAVFNQIYKTPHRNNGK